MRSRGRLGKRFYLLQFECVLQETSFRINNTQKRMEEKAKLCCEMALRNNDKKKPQQLRDLKRLSLQESKILRVIYTKACT